MTEKRHDIELFADQLDVIVPPGRFDTPERDADPLLDAAILIASAPQPQALPAEARQRIRAQVLAAPPAPRRAFYPRKTIGGATRWGVAATIILVFLFIGLRPSVLASVPGDAFYPLKLAVEQAEILLASSTSDRALAHLAHAERRAQEAMTLAERGQLDEALLTDALDEMIAAAALARADEEITSHTILQLEARTAQVNVLLNAVLTLADQSDQIPPEPVADLARRIQATQSIGALLLPATATPLPSQTPPPTATAEPDVATEPGALPVVPSAWPTEQPAATAEAAESPVTMVVEGPVQAINGNVITVFDIDIEVDASDPILLEINIGDAVRVEGHLVMESNVITIIAVRIEFITPEIMEAPGQPPAPGPRPGRGSSRKS